MNWGSFNLNLLRVFDAMMRERSVTRCGDLIGLSQPAVSAALSNLRHATGDQLFVRRGNEMVPTPRAEQLAEPIRSALESVERALQADASFDPSGTDRIYSLMGADFFSTLFMPAFFDRLSRQAPRMRMRFFDTSSGDVQRLLLEGQVDFALEQPQSPDLPDWIVHAVMFTSPFAFIAAKGHPALAAAGCQDGDELPLDLLCTLPCVMRSVDGSMSGYVDAALAKIGRRRRVVLVLPHFHGVGLAVAQGQAIAAVPIQFARAVAPALGLSVHSPPINVGAPEIRLYWHRRNDRSPAHVWLRGEILAEAANFAI